MPRAKKPPPVPIVWRNKVITPHPDVTAIEWAVAMALSNHMDNTTGKCYPGMGTLAGETRLSLSSVKKAIKGLEKKGLLEHKSRRKSARLHDSNIYTALGVGRTAPEGMAQGDQIVGRQASSVSSETPPGSIAPRGAQSQDEEPVLDGAGSLLVEAPSIDPSQCTRHGQMRWSESDKKWICDECMTAKTRSRARRAVERERGATIARASLNRQIADLGTYDGDKEQPDK